MKKSIFNKEGSLFVTLSHDNRLKLWDTQTSSLRQQYSHELHLAADYTCMSWCEETSKKKRKVDNHLGFMALGTSKGQVIVWDLSEGTVVHIIEASSPVTGICFSSSGHSIFASGEDKVIREFSLSNASLEKSIKGSKDNITALSLSPDGNSLLSASSNIRAWDLSSGKKLGKYAGHSSNVKHLFFSPSGNHFFSCTGDRNISMWSISSPSNTPLATFISPAAISSIDISLHYKGKKSGYIISSVDEHGVLHIFEVPEKGNEKPIFPSLSSKGGKCSASHFSSNNTIVIASGAASAIKPSFVTLNYIKDDGLTDKIEIPSHQGGLLLEKQNSEKRKEKDNSTHIVSVVEQAIPLPQDGSLLKKRKINEDEKVDDEDEEDDKKEEEEEEEEEEENEDEKPLGERLAALTKSLSYEVKEDEERGEEVSYAPSSNGSLQSVLQQALKSGDVKLLEYVLSVTDAKVISSTVERLPLDLVIKFLTSVVNKFEAHPQRGPQLILWIKAILMKHTSFLMSVPDLSQQLVALYSVVDSRLAVFDKLQSLSGRLDLLMSQIVTSNYTIEKEPLISYVEGEEGEGDDAEEEDGDEIDSEGLENNDGEDDEEEEDDDE